MVAIEYDDVGAGRVCLGLSDTTSGHVLWLSAWPRAVRDATTHNERIALQLAGAGAIAGLKGGPARYRLAQP